MLTIWDWEEERMGLHSKAFGQDIYKVAFSKDDSRRLTTSGTGHIRFWKMAATFTGLKLQGSIGKFGKIDLSDIEAFVELPDGKVVSGTETGALLLWEGNFIKCQFIQHGGSACHSGTITYLGLDRKEQCVISASTDGYIRWWDFNTMDSAEVDSDHSMNFELLPIAEYYVGGTDKSGVQTMVDSGYVGTFRYFVFQDTKGRLQCYKFNLSDGSEGNIIKLCDSVIKVNELITTKQEGIREIIDTTVSNDFHWGGITGMDTCPVDHLAATCSTDGTVRCVDYVKRKVIASKSFVSGATSLRWLPSSLHKAGKYMAVGYADGVVRILSLSQGSDGSYTFVRRMAFKPHNAAITDLSFNENGTVLATSGKDGIIFFMDCFDPDSRDGQWKPLRFVTFSTMGSTGKASITCEKISWSPSGLGILCSCNDGILREVNVKEIINNTEQLKAEETFNFELFLPINEISTKIPNNLQSSRESATNILGSIEEKENKEESASPAKPTQKDENSIQLVPLKTTSAIYSSGRSTPSLLLSGVSGQKAFLFESAIGEEIPLKELPLGLYSSDGKDYLKTPTTSVFRYSLSKNYLAVGAADGSVILKPSVFLETFTRNVGHNGSTGGVSAVACSFDDCYLLSAGADGCLVIYRVRQDIVNESSPGLFKDLDAGVFGSELTKSMPKESQPEPSYLSVVSTDQALPEEAAFKARFAALPAAVLAKPLPSEADEKDDVLPGQYSIQDNQLKLEQDAKQVAADDLKNRVRASVRTLQMDYEKILEENNRIPELARISAEEIMIDKEYFDLLEAEGVAMVEEVHRECEYESEKSERLLAKITERLTEGLVVEEMTLSAFNVNRNGAPSFVKSLRTKALNENLSVILEEVHRIVRETELKDAQIRTNETAQKKALEAVDEMKIRLNKDDDAPRVDIFASAAVVKDGEGNTSDSSVAVRRVRRKERKDRLTRHLAKKPDENEDDIRDVNAIKIAERTIGDFKLKCAEDYEVPEEQRINVTKKLRQMAMLEASIHTIRLQFNQRFLALRNLKKEIIYSIRRDNKRIKEIDTALKQQDLSKLLWQPEFDPTEFPDDDDEIIESELKEYETLKNNAKNWKDVKPSSRSVVTGTKTDITRNPVNGTYHVSVQKPYDELTNKLENFLSDEKLIDYTPPRSEGPRYFEESKLILSSYVRDKATRDVSEFLELENVVPILALTKEAMTGRSQQSVLSTSQEFILEEKRKTLQFEREMILKKLYENVKAFREAIDDLRVDRHSAVADIKLAEITLLIQFQEYKLLQTFEARDDALYHKQIRCKGEETEIKSNSNDNKVKLEAKQEEIQHWNEKLKQILSDFRSVVPDSHPYVEPLTKIFKKKIKRNKGNDRDDDDEDYEESDNDDDEDDEDDEEVEDICPPGCDPSIFERVIELREKKLDTDEVSAEIQRGIEELKKTIDRLKQREKQIIKDAQQTELEVQQFQLQKQAALNLINVVVPLKLGQIFMFESSGKLTGPTDKLLLPSEDPLESAEFPTAENVLHDLESRRLVSIMDLKSHAVFTNK